MNAAMSAMTLPALPAFIAPLEMTFPVDGEPLLVRPMSINQIASLMPLAGAVMDALAVLGPELMTRLQGGVPTFEDCNRLVGVLQDQAELPARLLDLALGMPGFAGKLLPDRFAYVFAVVVMVNADFFSRARSVFAAAGEVLGRAKAGQVQAQAQTGQPSSTP